jgi:PTS system ascorbate-specific IIB component
MAKSLKILVSCANGAGSSLMMKMAVEKACKELNVPVDHIHHCSLSEGKSSVNSYDIAFVALNFVEMYQKVATAKTTVIGLRNVMSAAEVKEKLLQTDFVPKQE